MTISIRPDLDDLHTLPKAHRDPVRLLGEFARDRIAPTAEARDRAPIGTVDWDLVTEAQDLGGLRMGLPEGMGGLGLGAEALGRVLEEFAAADPGFALILGATGLFQTPLVLAGDERLAAEYLMPFLGDEPLLACNAVAEELNGTDLVLAQNAPYATDMTTATERGDHYVLSGKKKYITNAPVARYATVMANIAGHPGSTGLTCFVVDLAWDGVQRGATHDKVGYRTAPAGELVFNDVEVPKENVVGDVLGGWDLNTTQGNICRVTCAAIATGLARHSLERALRWVTERRQSGRLLFEHQMTARKIADMAAAVESARALWVNAARTVDTTLPVPAYEPAIAKMVADRAAVDNANTAMSLIGAQAFQRDDEMERILRDSFGPRIYEGSPEALAMTVTDLLCLEDERR
ncbi:acyl-CoA dehydrogenase family protein [Nocardiopsis sp. CC223A]|uniref:acyl-CoA dehydrogenase family protein n=1 Tax=Nocardiopsis sp. CC223A TaxID=3044051 RepID=UPI00278BAE72|nr:acyl-CoA dehydrogenase family protein [Nocardiopsis sp. CC223A]